MNKPSSPHDSRLLTAKYAAQRQKPVWWGSQPSPPKLTDKPKGDYQKKRLIKYNTW